MRKTIIGLAAVAAIAAMTPATAAMASPGGEAMVEVPMYITGYDEAVATANGYQIVTGPDGVQRSVKVGEATPLNEVVGNCGSSYLYYDAVGNSSIKIRTGFHVNRPAVSYWWLVVTHDDGGSTSQNWAGGLLARKSWGVTRTLKNMTHGASDAYVSTGSSAILIDGGVCTSGGPSDFTWVY